MKINSNNKDLSKLISTEGTKPLDISAPNKAFETPGDVGTFIGQAALAGAVGYLAVKGTQLALDGIARTDLGRKLQNGLNGIAAEPVMVQPGTQA